MDMLRAADVGATAKSGPAVWRKVDSDGARVWTTGYEPHAGEEFNSAELAGWCVKHGGRECEITKPDGSPPASKTPLGPVLTPKQQSDAAWREREQRLAAAPPPPTIAKETTMPTIETPPTPAGGWPGRKNMDGRPDMKDSRNREAAGLPPIGGRSAETRAKHGAPVRSKAKPAGNGIAKPPPTAQSPRRLEAAATRAIGGTSPPVRKAVENEPLWIRLLRQEIEDLRASLAKHEELLAAWDATEWREAANA